jgi:hypothetical protein
VSSAHRGTCFRSKTPRHYALFRVRPLALSEAWIVGRNKVITISEPGGERLEHPRSAQFLASVLRFTATPETLHGGTQVHLSDKLRQWSRSLGDWVLLKKSSHQSGIEICPDLNDLSPLKRQIQQYRLSNLRPFKTCSTFIVATATVSAINPPTRHSVIVETHLPILRWCVCRVRSFHLSHRRFRN